MFRLAEYFVIFGYDFNKSKHNQSEGKIVQKFPKKDWPDYKYQMQVELFCQPCGWELSNIKHPPKYLVAYLTDPEANQYYLACLSFHEALSPSSDEQFNVGSTATKQLNVDSRNLSNTNCTLNGDSNSNNDSDPDPILDDPNLVRPSDRYAPKSLILLARHGFFDVLKNCLSLIYSIYMDPHGDISLEYVVARILSAIDVPPIGGSRVSFTIGAGDKQFIQPPVCATLPVTRSYVSMLFKHLGMQNVLAIFSSLINDQKILLYSRSFNRLTEACHALRSLLYPLKYVNVFIPILPKKLIEILSTPTPFLAGVHSTYRPLYDLTDVVMVDLDGGSVKFPDSTPLVLLSEPYNSLTIDSLTKILNPDLLTADEVYPPPPTPLHDPAWQDKQLRAVFVRLFCRLFAGYRSCLTLTRIRPKPVIQFNKSLFLLLRGLRNETDEFVSKLLDCMSFEQFIQDRGLPYRVCDVFDEEYESMTELLRSKLDSFDDLHIIDKLAKKLHDNEYRGTPIVHNLPREAKLAHTRLHPQPFRTLDENLIADNIKTNLRNKTAYQSLDNPELRVVPHGLELDKHIFKTEALSDKNKVIREFVANIFNNHITEALKRLNTIRQDLKNRLIRRNFVDELYRQLYPDQQITFNLNMADISNERKALLGYQQFDLINDLMGEALRHENQNEDSGVVPIIMELSTKFSTQLSNVRYYSNMTYQIQQHPIWENQNFWLTVFCDQVNNEIRQLYLHHSETQYRQRIDQNSSAGSQATADCSLASPGKKLSTRNIERISSRRTGISSQPSLSSKRQNLSTSSVSETQLSNVAHRILYTNKMSALDMAAEEMKIIGVSDPEVQSQEMSTIYAQILHFISLIVNFRIPINIVDKNEQRLHASHGQHQQAHTYSVDGDGDGISLATSASEDRDSESGYEDGGHTNARITNLETWLRKFVDKTGSDNNLSPNTIDSIKGKIEGIIEGHISNLEAIYPEVQNIPKVKKVEVTSPVLLPCERVILINNKESLRCYLLLDGRHEKLDLQRQREHDFDDIAGQLGYNQMGSAYHSKTRNNDEEEDDDFYALRPLLPAQGALFLTNYRLVFHGAPKDPYQSNRLVCRSFPIAALRSVKKLGVKTFAMASTNVPHGRSFNVITGRTVKLRASEGSLDVLRICSNTFQMMKIGLELEDFSADIKDELTIKLTLLRYPMTLNLSFNISDKIDKNHQKSSYFSGLPDDGNFSIPKHEPSESNISSLYSSVQNYSVSPIVHSLQTSRDSKNNFGRGTVTLAKEMSFNRILKVKGRTSPSSLTKKNYISESESELSSVIHEDECKEYTFPVTDVKLLDKLRITPGYQEYVRLNMASFSGNVAYHDQANVRNDMVRLIPNFNDRYQNVKSYPSMMVVPQLFNEPSLKKIAKTHRKNRFPIITWRSNKTNGYLIRGAGFQTQSILGKLMKQTGGGQASSGNSAATAGGSQIIRNAAATLQRPEHEITAAREQIRYFQALADISPSYEDIQVHLCNTDPLVHWSESASHRIANLKRNPLEKAYRNVMSSGSKAKTPSSEKMSTAKVSTLGTEALDDDTGLLLCTLPSQAGELRIVPLYILGEKSQMKTIGKSDSFPDIEFIGVDFTAKHQIKEAYECLVKAILPDNVSSVPLINNPTTTVAAKYQHQQPSFENTLAVAANKWLLQVQGLLDLAGSVVDLIDTQSASVAVCLEDGWDATSQIVSLAQIMLDRHYRTIEGFWALIEKDWLMAGHKFASRLHMTTHPKSGNFIPIFLQFLDSVHQLLRQFPMSFEFNDFFLKFLAHHHTSNRFHNFKMDFEADRVAWFRVLGDDSGLGSVNNDGNSIRNYILHHHGQWPVFFNFLYNPHLSQEVLRSCTNLALIDIWEYYLNEDLSSGSVYDLDHFCPSYRKRNTQQYDPILNGAFNNSHVAGIYAVLGLREGCEMKNWQKIWRESNEEKNGDMKMLESIMYDVYESEEVKADYSLNWPSSPGKRRHGASNIDYLVANFRHNKTTIAGIRDACFAEHRNISLLKLDKRHLEGPSDTGPGSNTADGNSFLTNKEHCLQRLSTQCEFQTVCQICRACAPLTGTIMVQCSRCHVICHDKCLRDSHRGCCIGSHVTTVTKSLSSSDALNVVAKTTARDRDVINATCDIATSQSEAANQTQNLLTTRSQTIPREVTIAFDMPKRKSEDLNSQGSEIIFSGFLWKLNQHTLFPSWQKKYFTLDIIRHELRYCDSKDSRTNIKRIHIQDITGVRILKTLQNHQKRFPESGFLEIQTEERTYKLASESQSVINEWMEKIQTSIQ